MIFSVAPKIEYSSDPRFAAEGREDVIFGLRLTPTYINSEGVNISLEGKATFAFSTIETKSGEAWAVTPMLVGKHCRKWWRVSEALRFVRCAS